MSIVPKEIALKIYLADSAREAWQQKKFIPVFHQWIRQSVVPDELLIDVTDYTHVHHGPGVMLIGHEANYSMDEGGGRPGLLYRRKQTSQPTLDQRVAEAFHAALRACRLLEQEPALEGMRFDVRAIDIVVQNRLFNPAIQGAEFTHIGEQLFRAHLASLGDEDHLTATAIVNAPHKSQECFTLQLRRP
jgi:hypothetical protein